MIPKSIEKLCLMFCGCCSKEGTWGEIFKELLRLEAKTFFPEDGLAQALVDHVGMSEHGTSVRGGWLTPEGKEALEFLREHGILWEDSAFWELSDGSWVGDSAKPERRYVTRSS